jgi:hypothetical protein
METQSISLSKNSILLEAKKLKPERKNVSFRIREDLYDSLTDFCHEHDVSSASIIESLIEKLLSSKE